MPFDGDPRAAYALLHDDGAVEHRRVAYDHAASAERVRAIFGPGGWADVVARRIETASI
jgi:diadenosine tetraphosphatase ApaH/serine/threonine PP2A family protein phosphatase